MITTKFLDELEKKIRQVRRAIARKERIDKLPEKIQVDVPFFNKQMEYTVIQGDKDLINQEATNKEQELRDKIKEIDKKPAQI